MLSLAYGKPAYIVGHDSRVSEFCDLMDIPRIDITSYTDDDLKRMIDNRVFDAGKFLRRWSTLSVKMNDFMSSIGLRSNLVADHTSGGSHPRNRTTVAGA
jgi:hypothetical protein